MLNLLSVTPGIHSMLQTSWSTLAFGLMALIIYSILNTQENLGDNLGMKSSHLLILVSWLFSLMLSLIYIGFLGMDFGSLISQFGIVSMWNMSFQDKKFSFQVSTIQPQGEILGINSMWSRATTGRKELILWIFLLIYSLSILVKIYF